MSFRSLSVGFTLRVVPCATVVEGNYGPRCTLGNPDSYTAQVAGACLSLHPPLPAATSHFWHVIGHAVSAKRLLFLLK